MPTTHIGRAVRAAIAATGETQTAIAQRAGLHPSAVCRIISSSRRPDVSTLRAICSPAAWRSPARAVAVLVEHLRDEIERAGHPPAAVDMRPAAEADDAAATLARLRRLAPDIGARVDALLAAIWRSVSGDVSAAGGARKFPAAKPGAAQITAEAPAIYRFRGKK
jgi:transcriptional regulator with XRE-family HTH domain